MNARSLLGLVLVASACAGGGEIVGDTDAESTGTIASGTSGDASTTVTGTSSISGEDSTGESTTLDSDDTGGSSSSSSSSSDSSSDSSDSSDSSASSSSSSSSDASSDTATAMVTLTVEKLGSGNGGVLSEPEGIQCGMECEAVFEAGTAVTLTAMAGGASVFVGWSGGDCEGNDTCELVLDEDTVVQATFVPDAPNVAFVASTAIAPMEIGGLDGADQICADAAEAAGLLGTYVAWLSSSTVDARDRLGTARGWVRPDGRPFADTLDDLTGRIDYYPPRLDELGNDLEGIQIVTGTHTDGTGPGYYTFCADWTADDGNIVGGGSSDGGAGAWTQFLSFDCTTPRHLLCLGIDQDFAVTVNPVPGRAAFVSTSVVAATEGIAAFDATCQAEADDAGLSGNFLAAVATSTDSIADRFDTNGEPWVRLDGVAIVGDADELATSTNLRAPLVVASDGSRLFGERVWTGTTAPYEVGPGDDACGDWSDPNIGDGWSALATESVYWTATGGTTSCDSGLLHLYCLEE